MSRVVKGVMVIKKSRIHNPVLAMEYDLVNGPATAKEWKLPASTLNRWKPRGIIPDHLALGEPLDNIGRLTEERLIRLVESGWLKARPVSRLM